MKSFRRRLSLVAALCVSPSFWGSFVAKVHAAAPKITFFDDDRKLPEPFRIGLEYTPNNISTISLKPLERRTGLANMRYGMQWKPLEMLSTRVGYKSDFEDKGMMAAVGGGVGMDIRGSQISYTCLPFATGGAEHRMSFTRRFVWK